MSREMEARRKILNIALSLLRFGGNMSYKTNFKAAILAGSVLLSSCSAFYSHEEEITAPVTDQPPITLATEAPEPVDPNIPAFLGTDHVDPPEAPSDTDFSDTPLPGVTNEPEITSPPVTLPEQTTDGAGFVVDDWRSGLEIDPPADITGLYEQFRIDRVAREGYYRMICSECTLPIVHISTEGESEILSRDEYVNCLVETMNCDDILKTTATGGIRVRGNASADYGNVDFIRNNIVSYRIKFDEKQPMLGLNEFARCRSWVLLKAYDTGVRNLLAFKLAETINDGKYYVSDSTPVQVYVNEKYAGLYILCEQTQENSERVDINEAKDGYEGTDIGYLVELDNYASRDDDPFFLLNYNNEEITDVDGTTRVPRKYAYSVKNDLYSDDQLKFIERRFEIYWEIALRAIRDGEFYKMDENYEIVPAQDEFATAYDCVNSVIDVESVVDMYLLYETVNDQDVGGGSFFFAVDYGQDSKYPRLTMVAPWDFDWGYSDYHCEPDGGLYAAKFKDDYFVENWGDRSNPWLILFYSADWFKDLVKQKFTEKRSAMEATMDEVEQIAVDHSEDFDKDGVNRAAKSVTTVNWARDRVEYLGGIWAD